MNAARSLTSSLRFSATFRSGRTILSSCSLHRLFNKTGSYDHFELPLISSVERRGRVASASSIELRRVRLRCGLVYVSEGEGRRRRVAYSPGNGFEVLHILECTDTDIFPLNNSRCQRIISDIFMEAGWSE